MNNLEPKQKEVRFMLPEDEHADFYERFKKLAIIGGKKEATLFSELIQDYVQRNGNILAEATWVSQPELIERLAEQGINTNAQTLYNWREEGLLDGLFGYDGGKGVLYRLEGVALMYESIKARPRQRKTRPPRKPASALKK